MLTMITPPRGNINVGNSPDYAQRPIRGGPIYLEEVSAL